ncbi:MAG TPA: aldose epimerase family protein [Chitinophagaceae bacterium]|nr:aldose epimerase family protein [Chitinophagaceae bacterium]
MISKTFYALFMITAFNSCNQPESKIPSSQPIAQIPEQNWGKLPGGKEAKLYTLSNHDMKVVISDYGGIIDSIVVPDKKGNPGNIVLGYPSLAECLSLKSNYPYFGAIIGRYANRICDGKFKLDGKEYTLAINNAPNSLHGGLIGFDKKLWSAIPKYDHDTSELELSYTSADMEEGYPGKLQVVVRYMLTADNQLIMDYQATTDKPTIVNLTNHTYFNLSGNPDSVIYDHEVYLNANHYLPIDSNFIPTGEILDVHDTPMDFTIPKKVGKDINDHFQQIKYAGGFDQTWVLNKSEKHELTLAARVRDSSTGREIQVYTTQPGIQFYSGNFLKGVVGRDGKVLTGREGLCLETHHFPDAPNVDYFPSPVLLPGSLYHEVTIYKFSCY